MKGENTVKRYWGAIIWAYIVLKENEGYWLFDKDYKHKYEIIKEAAESKANYTNDTVEYMASIANFMVEANARIFG